jgi:hypothetical protein
VPPEVRRLGRPPSIRPRAIGLLLMISLAVVLGACDLMIAPSPTPRPSRVSRTPEPLPTLVADPDDVPTPRPEGSGTGPDLVDAANALADLGSYRVSVTSTGLVPASSADGRVSMTSTLVQGNDPAAEFTMVGVDGLVGGRLQAIVIGDKAWLKEGGGSWTKSPGGAADFDAAFTTLSPIDLTSGFENLSAALVPGEIARKNGIRARHYHADSADPPVAAAGLTTGRADAWLAIDGGYLVSLAVAGTWDIDGAPTPVTLEIEVSRVNDRTNAVRPPA